MDEETTTSESVDSGAEAQLESTDTQTGAVNQDADTSQTSENTETGPDTSDNSEETELKDWAAKKNLPLDDPLKVAKMYRDAEKQMHETSKKSKEGQLKNAVTDANSEASIDDMQALKNEVAALGFYVQHPEAKQFEQEMVSILEEKPWLANDLEVVLDAAKGRSTTEATRLVAERQAGKKEALTQAAQAERAAPPATSATQPGYSSNSKITLDNVDELIAKNGQEWFVKNRDKINAVLAGN